MSFKSRLISVEAREESLSGKDKVRPSSAYICSLEENCCLGRSETKILKRIGPKIDP